MNDVQCTPLMIVIEINKFQHSLNRRIFEFANVQFQSKTQSNTISRHKLHMTISHLQNYNYYYFIC